MLTQESQKNAYSGVTHNVHLFILSEYSVPVITSI